MGAHGRPHAADTSTADSAAATEGRREREIAGEQRHLDTVYQRLEEKLAEAEYVLEDAAKRVQVGTLARSPSATPRSTGRAPT